MRKRNAIPVAELRDFLNRLGFHHRGTTNAWAFEHPQEGLIVFRLYGEQEAVDEGNLRSTRRFLDMRGVLASAAFDAAFEHKTPA
jgi:hypothetical protein